MNDYKKIFGDLSTIRKFKKKEIILEKDVIENYLSFIIEGSIAILTYHNGNEICISFSIENSFLNGKRTRGKQENIIQMEYNLIRGAELGKKKHNTPFKSVPQRSPSKDQ